MRGPILFKPAVAIALLLILVGHGGRGVSGIWMDDPGLADRYQCRPVKTYLVAVFMNPSPTPTKIEKAIEVNVGVQKFLPQQLDWDKLFTAVNYDINFWNWKMMEQAFEMRNTSYSIKIPANSAKLVSQRYMECSAWFGGKSSKSMEPVKRALGIWLKLEQDDIKLDLACRRRDVLVSNINATAPLPRIQPQPSFTEGLTFIRKPKYGPYGILDTTTLRKPDDDGTEFLQWLNSKLQNVWKQQPSVPGVPEPLQDLERDPGFPKQFGWEDTNEVTIVTAAKETTAAALFQPRAWCGDKLRVDAPAIPVNITEQTNATQRN